MTTQELVSRVQKDNNDTEAFDLLYKKFNRMVRPWFKIENEEAEQLKKIGLINGVNYYKPNKGSTVRTVVRRAMLHSLTPDFSKSKAIKRKAIVISQYDTDGSIKFDKSNSCLHVWFPVFYSIAREKIYRKYGTLCGEVFELYAQGLTKTEIAKELGTYFTRVDYYLKICLSYCRNLLEKGAFSVVRNIIQ